MSVQTIAAAMDTRVRIEMFQKGEVRQPFFNMKALAPRPISTATVFDTDFEDDDSEMDEADSPRISLNSSGRRSETTLSSFEEIQTPISDSQDFQGFNFDLASKKSVQGPRGPHLFRSSFASQEVDRHEEYVLAMSPMTPRPSSAQRAASIAAAPQVPQIAQRQRLTLKTDVALELNLDHVASWTPRQVSRWMADAGFEQSIADKFQENDISGAILITLKFEDLKELGIPSFGLRTKVWNEVHVLRGSVPSTPRPATPIDESTLYSPCTEIRRSPSQSQRREKSRDCDSDDEHSHPKRQMSSRTRQRRPNQTPITPLESVSIVGIEQLMPKPHKCKRGENCSKWRRQQRLIDAFMNDHPTSPEKGGSVWVAGDPGNPITGQAVAEMIRPTSEAVNSVVASSDVLGPGSAPMLGHLEEQNLRNLELRDPQDNVKQFIQFQHMDPYQPAWSSEVPPTPPYEMFPPMHHQPNHRNLPRLAIPPPRPERGPERSASAGGFTSYRMDRAEAMSPDLRNQTTSPASVYRFGTPFSDMDVPVTAINLGPVARDASQSVPPNMSFRTPSAPITSLQRNASRSSARRPSFLAMPRVDENTPNPPASPPTAAPKHRDQRQYPWLQQVDRTAADISYSGFMKKRKTKMLRHEWHEHHFTLQGTHLAMHKDARALETLEYIDVDDYAIACSSLAGGGKLNAAFKAMSISKGKGKGRDDAAFAFQLVPAAIEKGVRLRKRESAVMPNGMEAREGKGKVHHFAVKSRDERIDWMRELMLAKALKQKSEGYVINVNGNMI